MALIGVAAGADFLRKHVFLWLLLGACALPQSIGLANAGEMPPCSQADVWRSEHRIIDMHQHMDYAPELLNRAIKVMDASGVGLGIDLTPGTVTRGPNGEPSEFERDQKMEDTLYPGRWIRYMNLDYKNWDQPDFAAQAVKQVEQGRRLGAAGFKEWKRLGLYLRDSQGKLIKVDDPKLDPMWERLGELKMPVTIHVGDPKAFFEPYNEKNERWAELKDHPQWWFGDTNKFPTFHGLLEALGRVIGRHPRTTFVCAHFGNDAEELDRVGKSLDAHPNMMVDLAARIPELGRHNPQQVHDFFVKYQDRIVFGTDFQSLRTKMILGSSGSEPPPAVADAEVFFAKEWRWLETRDENWPHMTPIQGNWTISSIYLPDSVLRKIYFDNAQIAGPFLAAAHAEGPAHDVRFRTGRRPRQNPLAGDRARSSGGRNPRWRRPPRNLHHRARPLVPAIPLPELRMPLYRTHRLRTGANRRKTLPPGKRRSEFVGPRRGGGVYRRRSTKTESIRGIGSSSHG